MLPDASSLMDKLGGVDELFARPSRKESGAEVGSDSWTPLRAGASVTEPEGLGTNPLDRSVPA